MYMYMLSMDGMKTNGSPIHCITREKVSEKKFLKECKKATLHLLKESYTLHLSERMQEGYPILLKEHKKAILPFPKERKKATLHLQKYKANTG